MSKSVFTFLLGAVVGVLVSTIEWTSSQANSCASPSHSSPSCPHYERLLYFRPPVEQNDTFVAERLALVAEYGQLEQSIDVFLERWSTQTTILSSTARESLAQSPATTTIPPARSPGGSPLTHSGFLSKHLDEDVQRHPWWTKEGFNYSDFLPWPGRSEVGFMFAIVNNEVYVELKDSNYQRTPNSLWGLLELVERYPGRIKDTMGVITSWDKNLFADANYPMHISQICETRSNCPAVHNGLLMPDWTFWGNWMYNKSDWERELPALQQDRIRVPWKSRKPLVYWRGAPVSVHRIKAVSCMHKAPYNTSLAIFLTEYKDEMKGEAPHYRYALHLPGPDMWSVARKYHMAVGSTVIDPNIPSGAFWDRDLPPELIVPIPGYWENRDTSWGANNDTLCELLAAAQRWGEEHQEEAEALARNMGRWIDEHLTMDHVYEYMLDVFDVWNKKVWRGPVVITPWMRKISRKTFLQVLPCLPDQLRVYFLTHFPITRELARPSDGKCNINLFWDTQRNVWCGMDGKGCLNPKPGT